MLVALSFIFNNHNSNNNKSSWTLRDKALITRRIDHRQRRKLLRHHSYAVTDLQSSRTKCLGAYFW